MRADFHAVLDFCVLANFGVADLLFRLAEGPRLYLPLWSAEIMAETKKAQIQKLGWNVGLADYFQSELQKTFPEAWISGYEQITHALSNDLHDRHVLAVAIRARAEVIVTFNLKHFRKEHLNPWGVDAKHPSEFLQNLYDLDGEVVISKLHDIATARNKSIGECLKQLSRSVPAFVQHTASVLEIDLDAIQ